MIKIDKYRGNIFVFLFVFFFGILVLLSDIFEYYIKWFLLLLLLLLCCSFSFEKNKSSFEFRIIFRGEEREGRLLKELQNSSIKSYVRRYILSIYICCLKLQLTDMKISTFLEHPVYLN